MHEATVKKVETDELGNIVATVDFPHDTCETETGVAVSAEDPCVWCAHRIVLAPEAIGSRQALYGIGDPKDALDAIVREHMKRRLNIPAEAEGRDHDLGGMHTKIRVKHHRANGATGVLEEHRDRIARAHELRTVQS